MTIKSLTAAAALLLGGATCSNAAAGDPFPFVNGDLILGFQAAGGTGSDKNVFVDLGPAVNFRDNPALGTRASINATLTAAYGANWYSRTDLYCGVIGNLNFGPNSGFGAQQPVNGDSSRTFYVSTPAATPGQGVLIPAATYTPSALGIAGNNLSGTEGILTGLTIEADGSAILDQTIKPVEWNNGWTNWNPTSQPVSYGAFSGGIQQTFGMVGSKTYLDVQRILAYSTGASPAGVVGGGAYATTIAISSAGVVSAQNAVPPAQPLIGVQQPAGINLTAGTATSDFGSVNLGSNKNLTFTIINTGNADLTGLTITKDGANASDFVVTANPVAPLAGSGSTFFTVRFTPSVRGSHTAAIHIASNDSSNNPFDITLTGTGLAPEIAIEQPVGTDIPVNGSKDFGNVLVGSPSSLVFTIKNTGNADLTDLTTTIDGVNASDFTVMAAPAAPVGGGSSTTFTVNFAPGIAGPKTAAIHIANNDANENPFNIALTGTGLAPQIAVEQPVGTDIPDAGSQSFGNVPTTSGKNLTFTIRNSGTGSLTGIAIIKDGANAADFAMVTVPAATIAAGSSATFVVKFSPSATGSRSAAIHIANNDANENPFDITLTGTGTAPEIAVEQPAGTDIPDAGSQSFGNVPTTSGKNLTFTIKNSGTGSLTGIAITKDGANAADFAVVTVPAATIAAGSSATFVVKFSPSATGSRSAAIHIANNDANESPFDITLTGTGTALAAPPRSVFMQAAGALSEPTIPTLQISGDTCRTLTTVNPVDGLKYRTMLINKAPGTACQRRIVEVSSDLLTWYSGKNHTTILHNDPLVLKVRDNTPVSRESKRFIRLAPQP